MWTVLIIIGLIAYGGLMFFVGANNPPAGIKKKIIAKAQSTLSKL